MNLGWCVAVLFGIVSIVMWLYAGEMKAQRDYALKYATDADTLRLNLEAINLDLIDEATRAIEERDKALAVSVKKFNECNEYMSKWNLEVLARRRINMMNAESEAEIKRRASLSAKKGWDNRNAVEEIVHEM